MMFQNNFQQPWPQGTGYQYMGMANPTPIKRSNVLTQEEIQRLIKKENDFSLQLTETELLRAKCNHRTADGTQDALQETPVGCKCAICGYEFKPVDIETTPESIQEAVDTVVDIIQTVKLLYATLPNEAAAEYFPIIPLIEKLPKLFDYAVKDYIKHERPNAYMYNNKGMSTMNLFNMLCNGSGMGMGYQQPYAAPQDPNMMMGGMPQYNAAPFGGYPNPAFAPQFGAAPVQGETNGFGYYPNTTAYQYNPNMMAAAPVAAQPQAAPAQPTDSLPTATPVETQNQTFKA